MATSDHWWDEAILSAMKLDEDFDPDKTFKVRLDTNNENIRAAFGIPPHQFGYEQEAPSFEDMTEMLHQFNRSRGRWRQPPPTENDQRDWALRQEREIGNCTAASCGVVASYGIRREGFNERVCLGHATAILRYASERGVKLVLFQLEQVTHMIPPEGGTMPCCGRTPFEVHRFDMMTQIPGLVTCKPLRN